MNRSASIAAIENENWDVVIIGGGATGLGIALDSQLRGYRTLLVEKNDFCAGTSSKSTKLVHGGLRYLKQGNLSLVKEALHERNLLLQNAPNGVHPLEFIIPTYSLGESLFYQIGLKGYDWLASRFCLPASKRIGRDQLRVDLPLLRDDGLCAGLSYYDGQFDDARLGIAIAQAATQAGAFLANYVSVHGFEKKHGRLQEVILCDELAGRVLRAKAKVFINATGVGSNFVQELTGAPMPYKISPSRGTHLVFPQRIFPLAKAVLIPKTQDGRVLFALPWLGYTLVGTTDVATSEVVDHPVPTPEEVKYLLDICGQYFKKEFSQEEVTACFAGLRPLIQEADKNNTKDIDRKHTVHINEAGLVSVMGGKWTTYRKMAEDCLDKIGAAGMLPRQACATEHYTLMKDQEEPVAKGQSALLHPDFPYREKDLQTAIINEMPQSLEDLLSRRLRCLFLHTTSALALAEKAVSPLARHLGKSATWEEEELRCFRKAAQRFTVPASRFTL